MNNVFRQTIEIISAQIDLSIGKKEKPEKGIFEII